MDVAAKNIQAKLSSKQKLALSEKGGAMQEQKKYRNEESEEETGQTAMDGGVGSLSWEMGNSHDRERNGNQSNDMEDPVWERGGEEWEQEEEIHA